jgi:hypothetical protein
MNYFSNHGFIKVTPAVWCLVLFKVGAALLKSNPRKEQSSEAEYTVSPTMQVYQISYLCAGIQCIRDFDSRSKIHTVPVLSPEATIVLVVEWWRHDASWSGMYKSLPMRTAPSLQPTLNTPSDSCSILKIPKPNESIWLTRRNLLSYTSTILRSPDFDAVYLSRW